jgi:hypothetical protein
LLKARIPEMEILIAIFVLGTAIFLIIGLARRRGFNLTAWTFLGVFLLLTIVQPLSGLFFSIESFSQTPAEDLSVNVNIPGILGGIASNAFYYFILDIGFLLLILVGTIFARHLGRVVLLLPLGYIIPTVVLGRFYNSNDPAYSLFWISLSVLVFRVLVTLVAPIWIVRAASEHSKRRAGAITMVFTMGILLAAHAGYLFANLAAFGYGSRLEDFYYSFLPDLIMLAGIALAINLYRLTAQTQSAPELAEVASAIP